MNDEIAKMDGREHGLCLCWCLQYLARILSAYVQDAQKKHGQHFIVWFVSVRVKLIHSFFPPMLIYVDFFSVCFRAD